MDRKVLFFSQNHAFDVQNLSDKLDRMQNEKDIYESEIVRLRENIHRIDHEATRTLNQVEFTVLEAIVSTAHF